MNLSGRAAELAEELTAAGVRATADPAAVNPPCVLVTMTSQVFDANCAGNVEWHLLALAPGEGGYGSWKALDEMLGKVRGVLRLEQVTFSLTLPITGLAPQPCYDAVYREYLEDD